MLTKSIYGVKRQAATKNKAARSDNKLAPKRISAISPTLYHARDAALLHLFSSTAPIVNVIPTELAF